MPRMPTDFVQSWFRGRRVLVTGHTGFKGAWLCEWLLAAGAEVFGLALEPPSTPSLFEESGLSGRMHDARGDVRDARAVADSFARAKPEAVVHLAAQSLVRPSYAAPAETLDTNIMGVARVLDAVRVRGERCAVLVATSDKCYRPEPGGERVHAEDDALGGDDPYSASKAGAEIVAHTYRASFFPPGELSRHGVLLSTVRAGNVIGGGDWSRDRLLPDLARAFAAGVPVELRHPDAVRPWQHVLDALSGYLCVLGLSLARLEGAAGALDAATLAGAWNFGPEDADRPPTVREIAERFDLAIGGRGWVARPDPLAPRESAALRLTARKAERELSWRPVWSSARGVEAAVSWYERRARGEDVRGLVREELDRYHADARAAGALWAAPEPTRPYVHRMPQHR